MNIKLPIACCSALIAIALFTNMAYCQSDADFSGISQSKQIWGPKITPESLKGKVVFLEYWGIHCPPCRKAMPHLQEMQKELGKTGLFTVIGTHGQPYEPEVDKFLKETGVTFPVYQHLRHSSSSQVQGIPRAFLYDATGKLVADGHPMEVSQKVASLVKQAALLKKSGALPGQAGGALPGGLAHPFADANFGKFQKTAMDMFTPGKNWSSNYKKLQKAAQGEENTDAQQALEMLDGYITQESTRLLELANESPAEAFMALDKLSKSLKGMEQGKEVVDLYDLLNADKNVKELAGILLDIGKFEAASKNMKPTMAKTKAGNLFNSLKKFCERKELDSKLKKEAFKAARSLKEKYSGSKLAEQNRGNI